MQIYLAKSGQQTGPFSEDQIQSMLSAGMVDLQDSAWREGLSEWLPLHNLLNVASPIPQQPTMPISSLPIQSGDQVRPWIRYWARVIDFLLFSMCAGFVIGLVAPELLTINDMLFGVLTAFFWCFLEPLFLSTWGATPGKALLRVSVHNADGSLLDYGSALSRSFAVCFRGFGLGLPLISLITHLAAYNALQVDGITSWDSARHLCVTHNTIGPLRVIAAVVLFLLFGLFISLGKSA